MISFMGWVCGKASRERGKRQWGQIVHDGHGIGVMFVQPMKHTENDFLRLLHSAAATGEDALDRMRLLLSKQTGRGKPQRIVAYAGYAGGGAVHLSGRVLSNLPRSGIPADGGWLRNLADTWHQWESDEVPGASVSIRYQDHERTVTADGEGYYQADFPAPAPAPGALVWHTATARTGEVQTVHDIMVPPSDARFGIISDLDDTVIHTGITSLFLAAKLTFLGNAKTRKPLDGVAALYHTLQRGSGGAPLNPIFYISSSPWNLHDLLADFLRHNEIPSGPLLLRDLGIDRTKFIKERGHGHKSDKALALMDLYPELPFVLIGDSGQEDPRIYSELTRLRPGRILAIYIRDVDPHADSPRDAATHLAVDVAAAAGVPMILARDSLSISDHARRIGLISASETKEVAADVQADKALPDTGEQALKGAIETARKSV